MHQDRKKSTALVLLIVFGVLFGCCGILTIGYRWLAAQFEPGPFYSMKVDGDQLYVAESISQREFVITDGKPAEVNIAWNGNELIFKDAVAEVRMKAEFTDDCFWSSRHKAAFYIKQFRSRGEQTSELWQWTQKEGFARLHIYDQDIRCLRESVDGKYLTGVYYNFGDNPSGGIVTYEVLEHKAKTYKIRDQLSEAIMIEPDQFLISGNPGLIWSASKEKSELISESGDLDQLTVFHGEVWALRYENEKYQMVKLSKDCRKFDRIIDFPSDFPKVNPAGRGWD